MPCLQLALHEVRKDKSRVTEVVLPCLRDSFYGEDRQLCERIAAVFKMVVWEADTKGDAGRRPDFQEKYEEVLGDLADASGGRSRERCVVCGWDLYREESVRSDLL